MNISKISGPLSKNTNTSFVDKTATEIPAKLRLNHMGIKVEDTSFVDRFVAKNTKPNLLTRIKNIFTGNK
ncbi:MAG: hypothetical protein LUE64_07430 [Candidatus Gastranaerophilales bacterium]|nr:hypothetical protein [Candidatus Gastranaerophilales bacterium]